MLSAAIAVVALTVVKVPVLGVVVPIAVASIVPPVAASLAMATDPVPCGVIWMDTLASEPFTPRRTFWPVLPPVIAKAFTAVALGTIVRALLPPPVPD